MAATYREGMVYNGPEDPLWSTGQDTRLPNGTSAVRIRCSANAFELNDLNK